jgi:hypothetical protein
MALAEPRECANIGRAKGDSDGSLWNFAERLSRLFSVSPTGRCVSAPTCGTSISAVIVFARMASPSKLSSPNGASRNVSYCKSTSFDLHQDFYALCHFTKWGDVRFGSMLSKNDFGPGSEEDFRRITSQ